MPELKENAPSGAMYALSDALPAGDLLGAENTGCRGITLALLRNLGAFGDDEAGAGALHVIGDVDRAWHFARAGAITRHRRHYDPVGQVEGAKLKRGENVDVLRALGHGLEEISLWCDF